MIERWKPVDCEQCDLKSSIKHDDGKIFCLVTGGLIGVSPCIIEGPFMRIPKTLLRREERVNAVGNLVGV